MFNGMLSFFNPELARGLNQTYEFRVDDEVFHVTVQDGHAIGNMSRAHHPDLVWVSESRAFMELVLGMTPIDKAAASNALVIGDRHMLKQVLELFNPAR